MTDVSARPVRDCGTADEHHQLLLTVPGYAAARAQSENNAWAAARRAPVERTGVTTIPVVVHVVFNTPAQNITDEQIHSQIAVLNADYRKANTDCGTCPPVFGALAEDARIEFALASVDPAGAATTGITRTGTDESSFGQDDGVKSVAPGWPRENYLNLWVCPLRSPLLGYATFPGGPADVDGVVILHSAFGTLGTATTPFDLGRTATHEIGHWLNLHHIGGDDGTGCNGSDFVDDTPNQAGQNTGRPEFPRVSCNNGPDGDMFVNYMDYVDDAVMVMFSRGQVVRMQTSLDNDRRDIGLNSPARQWRHADLSAGLDVPAITGRPYGYAFDGQGTQHVVYAGAGGRVTELWWMSGHGWNVTDLTADTSAPAAAGDPAAYMFDGQNTQQVVFRACDGSVNEMWWQHNDGWHLADLTKAAHAGPAGGDPAGYVFDAQGTEHVFYSDADRHVAELWWERNSGWHVTDLTAEAGAPPAAGRLSGYVFTAQSTQHLVYRGDDGHILELTEQAGAWTLADLTTTAAAPVAAGDPAGYEFAGAGTRHVIYRGADDHIVELRHDGTGWSVADLTAIAAAPAAAGDPAAYMFDAQLTQHVVYRDSQGHINELWWQAPDGWQLHDLTAATTDAPPAVTDPSGYMLDAQATQHVVYGAADGHVHELWWG